jgi:hypothetical protein
VLLDPPAAPLVLLDPLAAPLVLLDPLAAPLVLLDLQAAPLVLLDPPAAAYHLVFARVLLYPLSAASLAGNMQDAGSSSLDGCWYGINRLFARRCVRKMQDRCDSQIHNSLSFSC